MLTTQRKGSSVYFALLIRGDAERLTAETPEAFAEIAHRVDAFDARMTAEGRNAGSVRLGDHGTRVLRLRGDRPFLTDGPFAETKEQLGGIYLIAADDIDQATAFAEDLVMGFGSIEIRPVVGIDLRGELLVESDM